LPQDDPQHRKPDITRARELLNWSPAIQLNEGLRLAATYFAERP
jgi:nucleoside-diphosphate-sugar epimerase